MLLADRDDVRFPLCWHMCHHHHWIIYNFFGRKFSLFLSTATVHLSHFFFSFYFETQTRIICVCTCAHVYTHQFVFFAAIYRYFLYIYLTDTHARTQTLNIAQGWFLKICKLKKRKIANNFVILFRQLQKKNVLIQNQRILFLACTRCEKVFTKQNKIDQQQCTRIYYDV